MRNVEFKAELRDLALARSIAAATGATLAERMIQTDTYYRLASGRLKRREIRYLAAESGADPAGERFGSQISANPPAPDETDEEWIRYDRPDRATAKTSDFSIYTPEAAAERFGASLPEPWVVVRKVREVWLGGPGPARGVRIHLDIVEGLGTFIEFEAPVIAGRGEDDRDGEAARRAVAALRESFRLAMGEAIDCSYSDLIVGR